MIGKVRALHIHSKHSKWNILVEQPFQATHETGHCEIDHITGLNEPREEMELLCDSRIGHGIVDEIARIYTHHHQSRLVVCIEKRKTFQICIGYHRSA